MAIGAEMDPRQHNFMEAGPPEFFDTLQDIIHRHTAAATPGIGHDAVRAKSVAAILDF